MRKNQFKINKRLCQKALDCLDIYPERSTAGYQACRRIQLLIDSLPPEEIDISELVVNLLRAYRWKRSVCISKRDDGSIVLFDQIDGCTYGDITIFIRGRKIQYIEGRITKEIKFLFNYYLYNTHVVDDILIDEDPTSGWKRSEYTKTWDYFVDSVWDLETISKCYSVNPFDKDAENNARFNRQIEKEANDKTRVVYLCDQMDSKCIGSSICGQECFHTSNIEHSINYAERPSIEELEDDTKFEKFDGFGDGLVEYYEKGKIDILEGDSND